MNYVIYYIQYIMGNNLGYDMIILHKFVFKLIKIDTNDNRIVFVLTQLLLVSYPYLICKILE